MESKTENLVPKMKTIPIRTKPMKRKASIKNKIRMFKMQSDKKIRRLEDKKKQLFEAAKFYEKKYKNLKFKTENETIPMHEKVIDGQNDIIDELAKIVKGVQEDKAEVVRSYSVKMQEVEKILNKLKRGGIIDDDMNIMEPTVVGSDLE
ncbi:hypothetical protein GCK72_024990 [Caenorhabditis remanei]|uniref:Uncharacterized protein n=1 Tax=Caenorhabditis remanei TaxID=31234 RepID=E3MRN9_CAERE|nr:hypothetical protein GCK72_024990 [Caenorhabditis remanei]EFP08036.1 hypothetical protein CRE_14740 [Caenorhabditis remanei]KAF1748523.1 hypothetical protein GCK72_024990 [Caenorhabditis remanei]